MLERIREKVRAKERLTEAEGLAPTEVEQLLSIHCVPVNWPIGMGSDFRGVYDRMSHKVILFQRAGDRPRLAHRQKGLGSQVQRVRQPARNSSISAASASGWSCCNMWPASCTTAMRQSGTAFRRSWYSASVYLPCHHWPRLSSVAVRRCRSGQGHRQKGEEDAERRRDHARHDRTPQSSRSFAAFSSSLNGSCVAPTASSGRMAATPSGSRAALVTGRVPSLRTWA